MEKSTFTPLYEHLRGKLVELREKAGLTQRGLAKRLGREPSLVSRIELAERRLDLVELLWVVDACGADPASVAHDLMEAFKSLENVRRPRSSAERKGRA